MSADRKEAYKINKYPYMPMYSPCAPWTGLTAHMQSTLKHKLEQLLVPQLLCQEGLGTSKAGHSQNHHLCSFPVDASIPLAWSSQSRCPALPAHPMATVLDHSVPRLFSIQPAQFMPLPVWPCSPSWEHQDIRLCPGGILAKGHGSKLAHAGVPTAYPIVSKGWAGEVKARTRTGNGAQPQFPCSGLHRLLQPPQGEAPAGQGPHCAAPLHVPHLRTPTQTHAHRHAPTRMLCSIYAASSP